MGAELDRLRAGGPGGGGLGGLGQRRRQGRVGLLAGQGQVQGASLLAVRDVDQGAVEGAALAGPGPPGGGRGQQRVGHPGALALHHQETRVDRVLKVGGRGEHGQLAGPEVAAQGDRQQQPALGLWQARDAGTEQVLDRIRQRQVLSDPRQAALLQGASELEREQRVSERDGLDPAQQVTGEGEREPLAQQPPQPAEVQRPDLERAPAVAAQGPFDGRDVQGPAREQDHHPCVLEPASGHEQRLDRRRVEPLDVVDGHQQRALGGQQPQHTDERQRDLVRVGRRPVGLGPQERHLERPALGLGQRGELRRGDAVEQVDERREGELGVGARGPGLQHPVAVRPGQGEPGLPERGLADARRPGQDEDGARGRPLSFDERAQRSELGLTAHDPHRPSLRIVVLPANPQLRHTDARVTRIWADPERFVDDAVAGFCDVYGDLVRAVPGGVVRATATPRGKVAVVTGGGSGHYPAFAGYVGAGLADAAVVGNVFASPSAAQVHDVAVAAERGAGVLLTFGNYAGDVLNFSLAAERLRDEGVPTQLLPVTDDIASAGADRVGDRRGVAGGVVVYKVAGAAAEAGYDLDEVVRVARLANDRTRSFGVAFTGCTLPGSSEPLFTVADGRIGVGLGVHGEPGIDEVPPLRADALAELLVARLAAEAPDDAPKRVVALLNGLGASKYEELFVLWRHVAEALGRHGLAVAAREAGELVTSLDMAGCSLTLAFLDDETLELWRAPAETPAYRRGAISAVRAHAASAPAAVAAVSYPQAGAASAAAAATLVPLLDALQQTLRDAEATLAELDTVAGDGDHGRAMRLGSQGAFEAASAAVEAGAGLASTLAAAADAWPDAAGGASGALWGVGLRAASAALDDRDRPSAEQVAGAVQAALDAVAARGGATVGDKTLVDALDPFARTLRERITAGAPLAEAWRAAAAAAEAGADGTARLTPRLGRARPLAARSMGHPDAGAVSLARAASGVAGALR